jgi:hypothetical protein
VGEKPPPELDGGRRQETLMSWELGREEKDQEVFYFF